MDAAPALRARLAAWSPDDPHAEFGFTARLARDNGWSQAYATRVVDEYRRFIELYVTAGHPVTPSDEVDQAWHLHLLYTRDYWGPFCQEVARTPIHHGPTRGGDDEQGKFDDWYERTRQSYQRTFGEPPPADVWPEADTRFRRGRTFVRVSRADVWLVPKLRVRRSVRAAAVGGVALTLLGGCTGAVLAGQMGWVGWALVAIGVALVVAAIRNLFWRRKEIRRLEMEIAFEEDPNRKQIKEARLKRMKADRRLFSGSSSGWFGCGGGAGCGGCSGCGGCGGCGG